MQKYHINLKMNRGFKSKQYYKDKGINNYIHYCWTELQNVEKKILYLEIIRCTNWSLAWKNIPYTIYKYPIQLPIHTIALR